MSEPVVRYLPYTLTTSERMVLDPGSGTVGDATCLDHVPGSVIAGVVASRLSQHPGGDGDVHRVLFSGEVRFLPAYLTIDSRRGLPAPTSWREPKDPVGSSAVLEVCDLASYDGARADAPDWPEEPLRRSRARYWLPDAEPRWANPLTGATLRIFVDRIRGVAWKDGEERNYGGMFTYEFLEREQQFTGIVQLVCASTGDADRLGDLVRRTLGGKPLLLGRARKTYGGHASVTWLEPAERESAGELLVDRDLEAGEACRVLLTSPYLGRDPLTGQQGPEGLAAELTGLLGGPEAVSVSGTRNRWEHRRVGAFSRKWSLPLPQWMALTAGSVLQVQALRRIPREVLRRAEHLGAGERRGTGHGRLLFLEPPPAGGTVHLRAADAPGGAEVTLPLPQAEEDLLDTLERRLLLAAVEQQVEAAAGRRAASANGLPSTSLIGRLRTMLRGEPEAAVAKVLAALEGRPKALGPARSCRLRAADGRTRALDEWLQDVLADFETLERELSLADLARRRHLTDPERALGLLDLDALRVALADRVLALLAVKQRAAEATEVPA